MPVHCTWTTAETGCQALLAAMQAHLEENEAFLAKFLALLIGVRVLWLALLAWLRVGLALGWSVSFERLLQALSQGMSQQI